jgi:hypothetical protein
LIQELNPTPLYTHNHKVLLVAKPWTWESASIFEKKKKKTKEWKVLFIKKYPLTKTKGYGQKLELPKIVKKTHANKN